MNRLITLKQQISSTTNSQEYVYSVPIGPQKKGETRIYRNPKAVHGLLQPPSHIHSLADFWDQIIIKYQNNFALEKMTYKQLSSMSMSLGSWLYQNNHSKIYLFAKNSPQWTVTDIASWNYGTINIPLYETYGKQAFFHIIKLTQGSVIFITDSTSQSLITYLEINKQKINSVVYFDQPSQINASKLRNLGLQVQKFSDLIKHKVIKRPKLNLDQHLTYAFTSGTTGLPKGVICTHKMVITQILAVSNQSPMSNDDVHLSYLPIAHSFERFVIWRVLFNGANIIYSKYPITEIVKNLAYAKPTVLPMIPRLLNKLYPICKQLYEKEGNSSKVKALFGGRLKLLAIGSAPISPQVLTFFSKALDCNVREGYGQTQTTAASFVIQQKQTNYGHVGGPNTATQFKLVDVPQMNYLSTDNPPRGQICTRGNSVFKQYYLDQKNTKETVDSQGWNHSGDIGIILSNGALKIIDRKKNIYKLSQGEYIAPQKIQNVYLRCPIVAECFLYGNSLQNYNIAFIYPNLQVLPTIAKKLGVNQTEISRITSNKKIEDFFIKEITDHGKKEGLLGFQLAKKIRLSPVSFSTLGIFTNTMKLQRHIAKKVFQSQIKELYQQK